MNRTIGNQFLKCLMALLLGMSCLAAGAAATLQQKDAAIGRGGPDAVPAMLAQAKALMRGKPDQALLIALKATAALLRLPASAERTVRLAEAHWLQGEAYLWLNDADHAAPMIQQGLDALANETHLSKLHADLLVSRGKLDTLKARVGNALVDFQSAHNIYQKLGETRSQAIALQQIASLYREADDFDTAIKYDEQSAEIYKGDFGLEVSNYNNRGSYFVENGRFKEAEVQYRLALQAARKINSPVLEARIIRNIARTLLKANKVADAERVIAMGMRLTANRDAKAGRDQILAISAQAAFQRGNYQRAAAAIGETFRGLDLADTSLSYRDAHETAYQSYARVGRLDLALAHLEALKRLDDKTAKLAASTNTALMAARFDDANKDAKIAKLKANEAVQSAAYEKSRARQQRTVFAGIVLTSLVGVAMLVYGLVTIRRSRNEVRASNIDLAATNTALEKALAAKTEFLATTSHEIRTPLNGILGMTQVMLADKNLEPAARDRLNVVHGAGVTMRALVDDILDVAKMETGNLTVEEVPLDLRETLREVSRLWEGQAATRGIRFVVELSECPVMIQGDAARLRQIVFNLLSNALKFTADGIVTLRAQETDDGRLRIAVSDTGIGIPADRLDVIFESFKQVDAGTTRKFGGTGLGLSICRNLAHAMGGEVNVYSVLGEGSTFAVILPLRRAQLPVVSDDAAVLDNDLLVVDGNPIARSMLRTLLSPSAGDIAFTASAREAENWLTIHRSAVVLIDDATVKAEDDVEAVLARIAARVHASGGQVALLWAKPTDEELESLRRAGIDRIIAKPIGAAALVEQLYPSSPHEVGGAARRHLVSYAA